jgi:signal peptidase I
MECSNCQFQNMPGVQNCGRCGASLQLASLAIDVHPPRASSAAKRWRRWFPTVVYWYRIRAAAGRALPFKRWSDLAPDLPAPGLLLRTVIPGWAQRHMGRARRGRWMFWCYVAALLSGLLFAGTALGLILLGLAVSVHAASILDILAAGVVTFKRRLAYSGVALFLLVLVLYYPVSQVVGCVASPVQFNLAAPPFEAGDVVLVNPSAYRWSDPQPGDIVQYTRPEQNIPMIGVHGFYRLQGDRIDRILAQAGDSVTCVAGELRVNGEPSPWLPLNPVRLPDSLKITVPGNSYFILASADVPGVLMWRLAGIVPRRQIVGRVYWHTQPLWRFGAIR